MNKTRFFINFFVIMSIVFVAFSSIASEENKFNRVKVAVLRNFPPQYSLSEKGKPQGFAIDVIEEVGKIANLKVDYVIKDSWPEMFDALQSGQVNLIPNMGITERRKSMFAFSHPVETFSVSIFTRYHENNISSLQSLSDKKAAVVRLNIGEILIKDQKGISIQTYNNANEALFNLLAGNVDAFIFPEPIVWLMIRQARLLDKIKVVGKPLAEVRRAISVNKGDILLLNQLNTSIDQLIGTERYRKIYSKWYGEPEPFWTIKKIISVSSFSLIIVIIFMGFWRYRSVMLINRKLENSIKKRRIAEEELQKAHDNLEEQVEVKTQALNHTLSELKALFDNSLIGIMVLKGGRVFHRGNHHIATILGYKSPSEMRGLPMEKLHLTEKRFHDFGEKYYSKLKNNTMIQIEYELKHKDGSAIWCTLSGKAFDTDTPADLNKGVVWVVDDISRKKHEEIEKEKLLNDLQAALNEVDQLNKLLPICSHCKKIRDDKGYWNQIESYITKHSGAEFSHSICEECLDKFYPEYNEE